MFNLLEQFGTILLGVLMASGTFMSDTLTKQWPHLGSTQSVHQSVAHYPHTIPSVPSRFTPGQALPKILIDNAAYQKAALLESQIQATTASNDPAEALVNIYCTYTTSDRIRYTTGSGFVITPTGVVLTNAHVAQFLLLETVNDTGETACIIRTGSPATAAYEAELLYISPAWIFEHAALIDDEAPRGTGERDYALLYISKGINEDPVPATLPFITLDTSLVNLNTIGNAVTIGGYPALTPNALTEAGLLTRETAATTLTDLYTFDTSFGDLYALGGTAIGVQGISGGPVIDSTGAAIGLITTRGDDINQGAGSLNAITTSYIDRTMQEETGFGIRENSSGNLPYRALMFKETIVPHLANLLAREL